MDIISDATGSAKRSINSAAGQLQSVADQTTKQLGAGSMVYSIPVQLVSKANVEVHKHADWKTCIFRIGHAKSFLRLHHSNAAFANFVAPPSDCFLPPLQAPLCLWAFDLLYSTGSGSRHCHSPIARKLWPSSSWRQMGPQSGAWCYFRCKPHGVGRRYRSDRGRSGCCGRRVCMASGSAD